MLGVTPRQIKLFISSLCISLCFACTAGGFASVYTRMTYMGIPAAFPTVVSYDSGTLILSSGDSHSAVDSSAVIQAELLRRRIDPLTLPRPVRLLLKLKAIFDAAE